MRKPWLGVALAAFLVGDTGLAQETRYFWVSRVDEMLRPDGYVLPLEDPEAIAHARTLIEEGPEAGPSIVVAAIGRGSAGVNRNYSDPSAPAWSWHVTRFLGFADITAEILDGNPPLVEDDVEWWMENTNGQIGFWNYTVVEELPLPRINITSTDGTIRLEWSSAGPEYRYIVEERSTLTNGGWSPAEGADWPIEETEWEDPQTAGDQKSYRVIATPAE